MKKNKSFIASLSILVFLSSNISFAPQLSNKKRDWMLKNFDESMKKNGLHYPRFQKTPLLDFFRKMYNKNNLSVKQTKPETQIPKIIHQIWLGSKLPEKYKVLQDTVIKYHPDWKYKLWTDEEVKKIKLYNQEFFDKSKNYAEKSDILRYEILYQFGGLYVDTDIECFKPFDILNENYKFYCGVRPLDHGYLSVQNCLIASVPDHPILKHIIENIQPKTVVGDIIERTGPKHFSKYFVDVSKTLSQKEYENVIALPSSYFFPTGLKNRTLRGKALKQHLKNFPEAFCIHYWDTSWSGDSNKFPDFQSEVERIQQGYNIHNIN
ncbi:glycosyltransferase family 32 protein [Candidatus Dependentiae bacterium]